MYSNYSIKWSHFPLSISQKPYLYGDEEFVIDGDIVLDENFDSINAETKKSVAILMRRIVRQYKHETDRIFKTH